MEKLLHERLRECSGGECDKNMNSFDGRGCKSGNGILCGDCIKNIFESIADEIEKNYIPIPLDKDGKRVDPGKIYFGADGRGWAIKGFLNDHYDVVGECDGKCQPLRAKWLSLAKIDTQECIDRDAKMIGTPWRYMRRVMDMSLEEIDKIHMLNRTVVVVEDLLRRQRKLMERDS